MSRRSGLGRGLAALIPPSEPEDREGADARDDASDDGIAPSGTGEPPAPTVELSSGASDPSTAPAPAEPDRGEVAPSPPDTALAAAPGPGGIDGRTADATPDGVEAGRAGDPSERTFRAAPEADEPARAAAPTPVPDPVAAAPDGVAPDGVAPAAVAPEAGVPSVTATLAEVAPGSIVPNPRQPREVFDPDELAHLATSLADVGILQPLVVRPLEDGSYELVAGERRLRAAMLAGMSTVPVVIRHTDDADLLKEALVENIHRVQLNPLEEGAAYQQLLEEFGVTQEELATRLGRSRPSISNAIRLLQLPPGVQRRVASGVLSAGHAKVLLAIEDPDQQRRLADRIVAEGMSVRATEELVRLRLLDEPGRSAASRRRPATAPGLVELQDDLSDALEARVRISMGAKRGRLAIEFASVDDLERIVSVIANGLEGRRDVAPVPPAIGGGTAPEPE